MPMHHASQESPATGHAGAVGRGLILLAVGLISALPFITRQLLPAAMVAALALAVAVWRREPVAVQVTLIAFALAAWLQVPALGGPTLAMGLALLVFAAVVLPLRWLRSSVDWLRRGSLDRWTLLQVAGVVAISSGALLTWYLLTEPEVGALKALLAGRPAWALAAIGLGFALVNATVEEFIFRGVVTSSLQRVFGSALAVNLIQSISFGLLHKDGFPSGALGIAMAGTYAFMLGLLRQHSGGLLAPWIAHVAADITIFCIVVALPLR